MIRMNKWVLNLRVLLILSCWIIDRCILKLRTLIHLILMRLIDFILAILYIDWRLTFFLFISLLPELFSSRQIWFILFRLFKFFHIIIHKLFKHTFEVFLFYLKHRLTRTTIDFKTLFIAFIFFIFLFEYFNFLFFYLRITITLWKIILINLIFFSQWAISINLISLIFIFGLFLFMYYFTRILRFFWFFLTCWTWATCGFSPLFFFLINRITRFLFNFFFRLFVFHNANFWNWFSFF